MNPFPSVSLEKLHRLQQLRGLQALHYERVAMKMERYLYDPVAFLYDMIDWREGEGLSFYQEEVLNAIVEHHKACVRSGHGSGKTGTVAFFNLWFAVTSEMCMFNWKAMITAGVWRQLTQFAMPEIKLWARRLRWDKIGREPFNPRTELLDLSLKLEHGAINTVASNDAAKVEGAHAPRLAYTLDESKIIIPGVWDAVEGAFANAGEDTDSIAYALAVSTPGPPSGRFYSIHKRAPGTEDWWTRHITLEETIAAGRVSREWAEQRKRQWGENSSIYQAKVLGNFAADDEDSVIPLMWVEAAIERWYEWQRAGFPTVEGPQWTGVDVGRGGDSSVLARRTGHAVTLVVKNLRDTMALADIVAEEPGRAIVDVVGVGAGVYDRLKQRGKKPVPYAGSGKSLLRDRSRQFGMFNTRAAAYWHLRELLDPEFEPTLCLPPDDLLLSDLTTPRWEVSAGVPPKIKVETKESVVERLGRSPDRGDAIAMAFYADAVHTPTQLAMPSGTMPTTSLSPLG